MASYDGRIHALSRFHIGGVAYVGMGASAHRLHRHGEYPIVADAVIETGKAVRAYVYHIWPTEKSRKSWSA
jgi:hypothetical protein